MEKPNKILSDKINLKISEINEEGSLGLLAYGDIAFVAWREKKKQSNNHTR
ncbi:MAG TPA: hypothetical protein PKL92_10270 [Aquaticitalea sp.]|nr:hypothetical protein [Aquaticitalea sp.]